MINPGIIIGGVIIATAILGRLTRPRPETHRIPTLEEDYQQEYLHSIHWQEFRQIFTSKRENQACAICGIKHHLDIHHMTYDRKGAEDLRDCVRLCHMHHWQFHENMRQRNWPIRYDHCATMLVWMKDAHNDLAKNQSAHV